MTECIYKSDQVVYDKLCRWDTLTHTWKPYTLKEMTVAYRAMCNAYESEKKENARLKREVVYRLNTIIGDYDND